MSSSLKKVQSSLSRRYQPSHVQHHPTPIQLEPQLHCYGEPLIYRHMSLVYRPQRIPLCLVVIPFLSSIEPRDFITEILPLAIQLNITSCLYTTRKLDSSIILTRILPITDSIHGKSSRTRGVDEKARRPTRPISTSANL